MNERPDLHAIDGGDEDQVVRRARFQAAHPDIRIALEGCAWQGVIPTEDGGQEVVTRYELRHLLDELERRLARGEGGAEQPELGRSGRCGLVTAREEAPPQRLLPIAPRADICDSLTATWRTPVERLPPDAEQSLPLRPPHPSIQGVTLDVLLLRGGDLG
jgi:hypothetical protein